MADERKFDRSDVEQRHGEYRDDDPESVAESDAAVGNSTESDVVLDVPDLKVDEIELEVVDLRANVTLQAEVLDLVKLNVGADVHLDEAALKIKDVEAQALLKVRLDQVASILERVFQTIDRNPRIVDDPTARSEAAARQLAEDGTGAIENAGESTGKAVDDVGDTARTSTGKTTDRAPGDGHFPGLAGKMRAKIENCSRFPARHVILGAERKISGAVARLRNPHRAAQRDSGDAAKDVDESKAGEGWRAEARDGEENRSETERQEPGRRSRPRCGPRSPRRPRRPRSIRR